MINKFLKFGLLPKNLFLIGKTYSTSLNVYRRLKQKGINISHLSFKYDSHKSYDEQFSENIDAFTDDLRNILNVSKCKKIIVLDDGGELILSINAKIKNRTIIGVEQTTSGYEKIKLKNKEIFPVINIARSKAKLNIESPFIAASVLKRVNKFLENINRKPEKILIVGNGVIGKSLINDLKKKYFISAFDIDQCKSDICSLDSQLNNYDLILGCSGKKAMSEKQYPFLKKDVILVSASSSDREFDGVSFRKKIPRNFNPHKNIVHQGKYLLNSGVPINFFGGEFTDIPLDQIQLTLTLLFAGVFQAFSVENGSRGLIELNESLQTYIINNFENLNSSRLLVCNI
jgi:S-adenosylhomocysteine hydrolase